MLGTRGYARASLGTAAPGRLTRAHDYESALTSTGLKAFSWLFSGCSSWVGIPVTSFELSGSRSQGGLILRPLPAWAWLGFRPACGEGSELSSIDYSRSSNWRVPLPVKRPRRSGEFKRGGGGTILGTACAVRGRRAHVGVVLIHPTKLDASHVRTLCAW